jgi:nucleoside-diphosphate kinase
MEQTLIILKPDAVKRNLTGKILDIFLSKGLKLVELQMIVPTKKHIQEHYGKFIGKVFYPRIEEFMTSGRVIVAILEGYNAIKFTRKLIGSTNPIDAELGTIRQLFASSLEENVIHASEFPEDVLRERKIWLGKVESNKLKLKKHKKNQPVNLDLTPKTKSPQQNTGNYINHKRTLFSV